MSGHSDNGGFIYPNATVKKLFRDHCNQLNFGLMDNWAVYNAGIYEFMPMTWILFVWKFRILSYSHYQLTLQEMNNFHAVFEFLSSQSIETSLQKYSNRIYFCSIISRESFILILVRIRIFISYVELCGTHAIIYYLYIFYKR